MIPIPLLGLRDKIIIVLFLLLCFALFGVYLLQKQYSTVKDNWDQAVQFNNSKDDTIQYLTLHSGLLSAKVKTQELTIRNAYKMQNDERLSWIRQFEGINKRMNNLEQATRLTANVVASFKIPLRDTIINVGTDTAKHARTFDNHEEWFRLKGIVLDNQVFATPEVIVPLENVLYWQRPHKVLGIKFGRKQWFSETTSPNPYVKITKSEVTKISKRK